VSFYHRRFRRIETDARPLAEYKPPQSLDIPIEWNTVLLPHAHNPSGFLGSKVVVGLGRIVVLH
jgi:hypothetical protein